MNYNIQCRIARSLGGGFAGNPKETWGCVDYTDRTKPCVFCGMYDLRDYIALWRHKGKSYVFWCGSDVRNLSNGFTLNDGKLRLISKWLGTWWVERILKKAEHWVENSWEQNELLKFGIESKICPSFFGDIKEYKPYYFFSSNPDVYICCGKGRQAEYGFDTIERIAPRLPKLRFHLYGDNWITKHSNVFVHGQVIMGQMDEETKNMQCALRLNETDGFSEIIAKAVLREHYVVTKLKYPLIPSYETEDELVEYLGSLTRAYQPNVKARQYYQKIINQFPWCQS